MKKVFEFIKNNSDLVGYVVLSILFIVMNVLIYLNLDASMESDFSSELVLAKLLATEKKFLTTSWYYSTELRVINTNIISTLLFFITDNWKIVRIGTIVFMELVLFFSYYYLAKTLEIKHIPWIGLMVLGCVSYEYYKFVILCSSYIPHIAIAFISMALIIKIFKDKVNEKRYLITLLIIAYIGGLEGVRLVTVFYIPVFIASVVYCFIKQLDKLKIGKFDFKDESFKLVKICFLGFVVSVAGAATELIVLPNFGFSYKRDGAIVYYSDFKFDNLAQVINGWLLCFGYQSGDMVFNPIQLLLKGLFIIYFLVVCWSTIDILINPKYNKYEKFVSLFMLVGQIIFTLLFSFTTTWYKNRFLLPITAFANINIGVFFSRYKVKWQKWFFIIMISLYVFVNTPYQIKYITKNQSYIEFMDIKNILLENNCTNGYVDEHWNGHNLLTEFSNGEIETWIFGNNDIYDITQWLQVKTHMVDIPKDKTFLILHKYNIEGFGFNCNVDKYICYEDEERIVYIFDSDSQLKSFIS